MYKDSVAVLGITSQQKKCCPGFRYMQQQKLHKFNKIAFSCLGPQLSYQINNSDQQRNGDNIKVHVC